MFQVHLAEKNGLPDPFSKMLTLAIGPLNTI